MCGSTLNCMSALILGILLSGCIHIERAIDATVGPVMEVRLARTGWTDDGCMLRWTAINSSRFRTFQPLIDLEFEGDGGLLMSSHELALTEMRPKDEQTVDLELDIDTCHRLDSIRIIRACNVAPGSSCSLKTCQFADHCKLISPNGLPYASTRINLATVNNLPSLVELYILGFGGPGFVHGCLVSLEHEELPFTLAERAERCAGRFYGGDQKAGGQ